MSLVRRQEEYVMPLERVIYYLVVLVAIVLCGWFALEIIDRLVANT